MGCLVCLSFCGLPVLALLEGSRFSVPSACRYLVGCTRPALSVSSISVDAPSTSDVEQYLKLFL